MKKKGIWPEPVQQDLFQFVARHQYNRELLAKSKEKKQSVTGSVSDDDLSGESGLFPVIIRGNKIPYKKDVLSKYLPIPEERKTKDEAN